MLASEALFLNQPVAHVVAWYELQRQRRIADQIFKAARQQRRNRMGRI